MRLSELLRALGPASAWRRVGPPLDPPIRGLEAHSARVAPGDLFIARRGHRADGHDHLDEAVRAGAAALLVERLPEGFELGDCVAVLVPSTADVLARLAVAFYGRPADELELIGVTGTNGKTSTTYLVESILRRAGRRTGLLGTVEVRFGDARRRAINTTPDALELQRTLRAMRHRGVGTVVMEVSSHGLAERRVEGCHFAAAAFTNLSHDHLDYHRTMAAYLEAKTRLFRFHLRPGATAVVNLDDPHAAAFLHAARQAGARTIGVSRRANPEAAIRLERAEAHARGTRALVRTPAGARPFELPLLGEFNLENLVVAVGLAWGLEVPPEAIAEGVACCPQVPGRMERVEIDDPEAPTVLVDYAHTPDALDKLLASARALTRGRLITVFGCGGDRDREKRPAMAEAAARWSDLVIATSDNPRTEDPAQILAEIEAGFGSLERCAAVRLAEAQRAYTSVLERREAIRLAIAIASPSDTVVIAGKGHEDYQILGTERLPFDDRIEARRAWRERSAA